MVFDSGRLIFPSSVITIGPFTVDHYFCEKWRFSIFLPLFFHLLMIVIFYFFVIDLNMESIAIQLSLSHSIIVSYEESQTLKVFFTTVRLELCRNILNFYINLKLLKTLRSFGKSTTFSLSQWVIQCLIRFSFLRNFFITIKNRQKYKYTIEINS